MKAKLLTLLMALSAFAGIAKAASFESISVAFKIDGEKKTFSFPATGAEEVVIEEPVRSVESVRFLWARTYWNHSDGGQLDNVIFSCRVIDSYQNGVIGWQVNYMGDVDDTFYLEHLYPPFYIHEEWLTTTRDYTFEFLVYGKDGAGNWIYLNNGGENYKVTFRVGDRISFPEQNAAYFNLRYLSGEGYHDSSIFFNGDGSLSSTDNLGPVYNLSLNDISISQIEHASEIEMDDIEASFLYKVYEEGHGNEVGWSRIDMEGAQHNIDEWRNFYSFHSRSYVDLTEGLELDKDYVLETYFEVTAGNECHTFGKNNNEGTKIRFTLKEEVIVIEENPIKSLMLAYSLGNNDVEFPMLPESGFPETILQEPISSFKIYGGEAVTEETIQSLDLHAKVIEVDNPDPETAEHIWATIPFTDNGFGMWTIELPSPRELMLEKWQEEHKRITFELYIEGTDQNGEPVLFNNGGEGYKFTFTCCEDTDRGIKNFTLTIDINGEVIPVPVPATDAEDSEIPFPLSIFRIMKAEVKTYTPMKSVTFFSTLYNTADGVSYDQDAWKMTSFVKQGENSWVIDMPYGKELIEDEWLLQNTRMRKTYQFFVRAEGEDGNDYFFNNGDNMYKIIFTCDDADGISLTPNPSPVGEGSIYNLSGQRLQKAQKGINIIGGKKVLVK